MQRTEELGGPRGAAVAEDGRLDGVRLAVLSNRMEGIVRRMTNTLLRTARSGVINTARDFSCCIVTADSELLATADSLPIHVMSGPDLVNAYMREVHPDLARGDAFLHNDPYNGNSHAGDHCMVVPVVDEDGRHRFTTIIKAHLSDVGNALPTTMNPLARDVYEEGALIFPCVRVQRDYADIRDIIRMCETRIRVPDFWRGDFSGMLAAARIGERELLALGEEVGWDALDAYVRQWFDYSEHRMVEAIRALPAGRAEASTTMDEFGECPAVTVTAKVEVDTEAATITVDATDNPDCLPFGINLTEATARTAAMVGVFMSIDASVPANAGSARRLRVLLREGCVAGIPSHPASCSLATTGVADRMTNATQMAMAKLGKGVGLAEVGAVLPASCANVSGNDPRRGGAPFVNKIMLGITGGAGAPQEDGWLTAVHAGSNGCIMRDSTEAAEFIYPLRIWVDEIEPDTEGPGEFRGAPSSRVEWSPADTEVEAIWLADGAINAPQGVRDGAGGAPGNQFIRHADGRLEPAPAVHHVVVAADQRVVSLSPGGGGYGPALARDPERVRHDVAEGWVSLARARETYGVVIDEDGEVDAVATAARRAAPPDSTA
jgi:N-methylhydantoinase B